MLYDLLKDTRAGHWGRERTQGGKRQWDRKDAGVGRTLGQERRRDGTRGQGRALGRKDAGMGH